MRGAVIVTSLDIEPTPDIDLDALVARSRRNGLRLIGPSSMGVAGLHPGTELQAALVDVTLPPDGVAISMQSGFPTPMIDVHYRNQTVGDVFVFGVTKRLTLSVLFTSAYFYSLKAKDS